MTSLQQTPELAGLGSGRSGAVGGAAALTFAAVLPRIGAAALALAIVLALAGVLGEVGVGLFWATNTPGVDDALAVGVPFCCAG
jgi:hypothetical protein